ncbi:MAG: DNA ligase [Gammaproteobacteria bacterium HGW-Gammaproteobacteria-3]|nr:MAG: DNA ligase [Gammaproteobacteria bacterium HGW-Gammaproteobacteria-3]
MLTDAQYDLLRQTAFQLDNLSVEQLENIAGLADAGGLSDAQLLEFLQVANLLYRGGQPLISDAVYDTVFLAELQRRQPRHPFLHTVEPEPAWTLKTLPLPEKMLSTEKAYSQDGIEKWLARVQKAAGELNLDFARLVFKATPKLDGYAAFDDGRVFYTRGDGSKGTDISRVFERGLSVAGNGARGQGAGEIVVSRRYFQDHLAGVFENTRNFQASIIKEKELEAHALAAIQAKAAVFFPFAQLPSWQGTAAQIRAEFDTLVTEIYGWLDYDVDGVVFEVIDASLKQALGATRHHHRWQIAFKTNALSVKVKVLGVTPQTSRSGRVNPVAELEPTQLSGALIARATAHHYGMVKNLGIGPGTLIELTRSGLVIPKIERVLKAQTPQIPERCPSCGSHLVWDSDYLYCLNKTKCPAQIEHTIEHFFRTLANVDGFGQKTIEKLHAEGIDSVYAVYQLTTTRLIAMGFGEKTAQNLIDQLQRSRSVAIEDWRFLGAFGIYRMGLGNCERLLRHYRLRDIFSLTVDDIVTIEGFAEKTAAAVVECLAQAQADFKRIFQLGFNLIPTDTSNDAPDDSPIKGKTIVFTGTMAQGSRDAMKKEAKRLGAIVSASVTGKTDFLVTGEKVGATKVVDARDKSVKVITEAQYRDLIS